MAAIDQRGELNAGRPAKRTERVHRSATGASCKKYVIHDNHSSLLKREREPGGPNDRKPTPSSNVVAVHRNIDHAGRNAHFFNCLNVGRNPSRQFDTARWNPGQDEGGQIAIALDDFVRDPAQRPVHRFRIEDTDRTSFFCYAGLTHFLCNLSGSP